MAQPIDQSLQKIVKGTSIVLIGTLIGMFFAFIGRILIARFFTQTEYGIFSLGFGIFNVFIIVSLLGLKDGATRQIAYYRGKNDFLKVKGVISSSIQIVLITSVILSITLFFIADIISIKIFNDPALATPLKLFAFSIPFFGLTNVLISIFRGFDQIKENVYFQNILASVLFPLLILPVIFFGLHFINVIYAFTVSIIVVCIILVFYSIKKIPLYLRGGKKSPKTNLIRKDLLIFSVPLLGVSVLQLIISWTDTLMLGGFTTSATVGLYNAASLLAQLLYMPMSAMLLIYAPIISGLYGKKLLPEIRKNFTILTKWVFFATLPLFLILFLFPETVLSFLYGIDYIPACQALRILSLGFIITSLLGPNGTTLIAAGKTGFLMWASMTAASMNIALNIALIPSLGIIGASIATAISLSIHCIIRHTKVHSLLKVNPLTKNLLKPTLISIGLVIIIYFSITNLLDVTFWMLPLLFFLFYGIYFLAILFSKSFDQEDLMFLKVIMSKTGIGTTTIEKIIEKFI